MLWVCNVKMMHTKRWIYETNVRLVLDLNNFQNVKAETTLQLDTKYVEATTNKMMTDTKSSLAAD